MWCSQERRTQQGKELLGAVYLVCPCRTQRNDVMCDGSADWLTHPHLLMQATLPTSTQFLHQGILKSGVYIVTTPRTQASRQNATSTGGSILIGRDISNLAGHMPSCATSLHPCICIKFLLGWAAAGASRQPQKRKRREETPYASLRLGWIPKAFRKSHESGMLAYSEGFL